MRRRSGFARRRESSFCDETVMKPFFRSYWAELALFLAGLALALAFYPFLPESIPLQWHNGQVASTGSKLLAFLFPLLLLAPFVVHALLSRPIGLFPLLQGLDRLLAALVGVVLLSCEVCVLLLAMGGKFRLEVVLLVELLLVPVVLLVFVARKFMKKIP